MSSLTKTRITQFCREILQRFGPADIGFADVGAGGDLKTPWSLLPAESLRTYGFEPTTPDPNGGPLCISNRNGRATFYVAKDERASSLHRALESFVARFGYDGMLVEKAIAVECKTLDDHFAGRYRDIDALDINVEGHDFQVLQGGTSLLDAAIVKLIKIEFELANVYEGQGYFADIDAFLRARGFTLANLQVDHVRPVTVKHLYHQGEPLWGKAIYTLPPAEVMRRLAASGLSDQAKLKREIATSMALFLAARLPGHVHDSIRVGEQVGLFTSNEGAELRRRIDVVFRWSRLEVAVAESWAFASAMPRRFFR